MPVTWTPAAVRHLADIHQYIAANSPRFAQAMIDRITARSAQLATFPKSGAVVAEYAEPDIREIIEGSYRIIYRVVGDAVEVLAVIHGARMLPPNA
jgi:plasmid stabilization system protein ParE